MTRRCMRELSGQVEKYVASGSLVLETEWNLYVVGLSPYLLLWILFERELTSCC